MKAIIQLDNVIIVEANILNISLNGAFIKFADFHILQPGDNWNIKIQLANSDVWLSFKSEVIHSQNRMVGVKFVHIDLDTMIHLRNLLEATANMPEPREDEVKYLFQEEKSN
jgi:hypothetical protein